MKRFGTFVFIALLTVMAGSPAGASTCHVDSYMGEPVPKTLAETLPSKLGQKGVSVEERKALFYETLAPVVRCVNAEVMRRRRFVMSATVSGDAGVIPVSMYKRYGVEPGAQKALLKRVNTVPAGLVLAQAIQETGWGRSRFAQDGNALFGEHTQTSDAGMRPRGYDPGQAPFYVERFETLKKSVISYIHRLNSHGAYAEFRRMRRQMRLDADTTDRSYRLAGTLTDYAADPDYVRRLRDLIRSEQLDENFTAVEGHFPVSVTLRMDVGGSGS